MGRKQKFYDTAADSLIEFAKYQFWLNQPLEDKATRRSHFEAAKRSGLKVKELEYEPLDPICEEWWEWFCELNSGRQSNGMGANVLGWGEIKAWAELTGNKPTPFDIEVIKRVDIAFIESSVDEQKNKKGN